MNELASSSSPSSPPIPKGPLFAAAGYKTVGRGREYKGEKGSFRICPGEKKGKKCIMVKNWNHSCLLAPCWTFDAFLGGPAISPPPPLKNT